MHPLLLIVALLFCVPALAADADNGETAVDAYAHFGNAIQSYWDEDYAEAFKEFRLLAAHGDATSQYYLGLLYHRGLGVSRDDAQAATWWRKAAEQGIAAAQNELGTLYFRGRGVAEDNTQAGLWLRKAAEQGGAKAQNDYSYWLGLQTRPDAKAQSIAWLRKAARQGDPIYQLKLAEIYGASGSGQEQPLKSAYWMRKAAAQGLGAAEAYLGAYYMYGIGVRKDYALALHWYQRGYAHGSSNAASGIALLYDAGLGVAKDEATAIEWYCKSARMGYGDADNAIFRLRALGKPGEPCLVEVAAAGKAVAQDMLGDTYRSEHREAEAIALYRKAAVQGYGQSLRKLADLYASGEGVPRDPVVAVALLTLSRTGGYGPADRADGELTPAQHAEVEALVAAWKPGQPLPEPGKPAH